MNCKTGQVFRKGGSYKIDILIVDFRIFYSAALISIFCNRLYIMKGFIETESFSL